MYKIIISIILLSVLLFQIGCADKVNGDNDSEDRVTRIISPFYQQSADDPMESPNIPEPPKDVNIKFLAAGDNMIHSNVYEDAFERARDDTPEYNFFDMYEGVADFIASADIAFINQETPIAGKEYG
jgi:Bacterial capsule synthesis protein PGA_cap.